MNKLDDIESWRIFFTVMESGSFNRAAQHLQVEVSTVSRRMSLLEKSLGQPLFLRSNRAFIATDVGQKTYAHMKPLLEQIDQLTESIGQAHGALTGEIRLSAPVTFGEQVLVHWLNAFQKHHPKVSFDLDLSNHFVDLNLSNHDLVVRLGHIHDERIVALPLGGTPQICVASPSYLATHGHPHQASDLSAHALLTYRSGQIENELLNYSTHDKHHKIKVHPYFTSNNIMALYQSALNHNGIALFLPLWLCRAALQKGDLVHVLNDWVVPPLEAHIATKQLINRPARVNALIRFLQDEWVKSSNGKGALATSWL